MDRELSDGLNANIKALQRYALGLVRNRNDADDLVQECLKRAVTYIRSGKEIQNMRAYLFTILNNVYMDELSKRRRFGKTVDIDDVSNTVSCLPNQISNLDCQDLSRALEELPSAQKQAVLLVGLEGMSYQSAADVMGVPVGTVMSRLSRGREALRHYMAGNGRGHHARRRTPAELQQIRARECAPSRYQPKRVNAR